MPARIAAQLAEELNPTAVTIPEAFIANGGNFLPFIFQPCSSTLIPVANKTRKA
jgi:hypothetical protein